MYERSSTYLLHEHDEERRLRGTSVARDGEHLTPQVLALTELLLDFQSGVDVVQVPGSLKG